MRSETDKAYMAGFVDGEGHIGIGVLASKTGRGRHTLTVTIVNTHIPTLEKLAEIWDGKVLGFRKRNTKRAWKQIADLRWSTKSAALMLLEIQPYLITKPEQCRVALDFAATIGTGATRTMTEELWNRREALRMEVRALNQRGGGTPAVPIAYVPMPSLTCRHCGKEFTTHQKRRRYCSQDCSMAAGREAYQERHSAERACPLCGTTFLAYRDQQYCSIRCGRQSSKGREQMDKARTKIRHMPDTAVTH